MSEDAPEAAEHELDEEVGPPEDSSAVAELDDPELPNDDPELPGEEAAVVTTHDQLHDEEN